jgi:very-short-patch-repair endonuclease
MLAQNIVSGQRVSPAKVERSKELRRELTTAERILWQQLRRNQLNGLHFRRQQIIDGFIAEFYCHVAGLVIELDGGIHQQQTDYDVERDKVLTARGLRVLRFKNEEVLRDLKNVLARIRAMCEET